LSTLREVFRMKFPARAFCTWSLVLLGCTSALAAELPTHYRQRRATVKYSVDTKGTGKVTVELYRTASGGRKWRKSGQVVREAKEADKHSRELSGEFPLDFKDDAEGVYDFAVSAVDERGNRDREIDTKTQPIFRVVIDRTPPWIIAKRLTPAGDPAEAQEVQFAWAARDPNLAEKPVTLQAKLKKEKSWQTVKTGLKPVGKAAFPELAAVAARLSAGMLEVRFHVEDLAGNVREDSAGSVLIDRLAPTARVTGPVMAASLDVDVLYDVADGGPAGLVDVGMWLSADGGQSWKRCKEKVPFDSGSVKIRLPRPGSYGLFISARDAVNNSTKVPEPGTKPMLTLLTDTAAPRLVFSNSKEIEGQAFSGRQRVLIQWRAVDDNLIKLPISIEFSSNAGDSWSTVASALANQRVPTGDKERDLEDEVLGEYSGSYWWQPPKANSTKCLLRITAIDMVGHRTAVLTRPFTVDNRAPRSTVIVKPTVDADVKAATPAVTSEAGARAPRADRARALISKLDADPDVREYLVRARTLLKRGLRKEAAAAAAAALLKSPNSIEGHALRGKALVGIDNRGALKHLERVIKLSPGADAIDADLAEVSFVLGKKRAEQGKRRSAERLLLQAVDRYGRVAARNRRSGANHYNLAQALIYLSRVETDGTASRERAERHLRKALYVSRRDPNVYANSCYYLATLREGAKDWPMATRYWDHVARIYGSKSVLGKRALARANRARGRR
jgi:tetratricopeptide (TPR) repeat protein